MKTTILKTSMLIIASIFFAITATAQTNSEIVQDSTACVTDDDDIVENYNKYLDSHFRTTHNPVAENIALKFMNTLLIDYATTGASAYKSRNFDANLWANLVLYLGGDLEEQSKYHNEIHGLYKILQGEYEDAEPAILGVYKTYIVNSTGSELLVRMRYYSDYALKHNQQEVQYEYGEVRLVKEGSLWKVITFDF